LSLEKKWAVPDYIWNLKTYKPGKPVAEVIREKGLTKVSKLASNENPLGPSPFAIKAMTNGLWELNQYPDAAAHELKEKLCKLYKLRHENIILGSGSEGIMAHLARAFLQPGDEVITCEQSFIGFYIIARSAGAVLKKVPLTDDYRFDVDAISSAINPETKVIYIANPNNPTGTYIKREEFDRLMKSVPDHCIVILDEAYYEFAKDFDDYPDSMDYRYNNVLTLRTFSKAYGLAGIRVGYGFGHDKIIRNLAKVKLPFEPNLIAQLGASSALDDRPHLERTLTNNSKRLEETIKFLREKNFEVIDSVTNFVMFKTGSEEKSEQLCEALLNEGVIIRPLKAHEIPEFVRVSIGTKEEMQHFYTAMEKVLKTLD
jgi:histidinol-phosphate aminotransferase